MIEIRESGNSIIIKIKVQPRASKNEIVGVHGDALKLKLTSPPVNGKANEGCLILLSESFGLKKGEIELISGKTGRDKKIRITGISGEEFMNILEDRGYV